MFRSLSLRYVILALSLIGLFSLTGPAYAWWPGDHETMIRALKATGRYSDHAINMMVYGSDCTDVAGHWYAIAYDTASQYSSKVLDIAATAPFNPPPPPRTTNGFHFDNLRNFTEVQQRWNDIRYWVIAKRPQTADPAAIRDWQLLDGMVYHAIEDFYCHSNWVLLVGDSGAGSLADPKNLPTWDELFGSQSAAWKASHPRFKAAEAIRDLQVPSYAGKPEFMGDGSIIPGLETGRWDQEGPGFYHREPGSRSGRDRNCINKAFPKEEDADEDEYDAALALAARATEQWEQFKDSLLASYTVGQLVLEAEEPPGPDPPIPGYDWRKIDNYKAVMSTFITMSCDGSGDVANISGDGRPPESVYMIHFIASDAAADSTLTPAFASYAANASIWPAILSAADPIGVARAYVAAGRLSFRGRAACPPLAPTILVDSLILIEHPQPQAYVTSSLCNSDPYAPSTRIDYSITSTGHIPTVSRLTGYTTVPGGECRDVYAVFNASTVPIHTCDTLTWIAWMGTPPDVAYDTCVQFVEVILPRGGPLFTVPVVTILVLALILAAAVFMRRRAVSRV